MIWKSSCRLLKIFRNGLNKHKKAIITAKLYEDIGKKNISKGEKNPFYNSVEVLGWNYIN